MYIFNCTGVYFKVIKYYTVNMLTVFSAIVIKKYDRYELIRPTSG